MSERIVTSDRLELRGMRFMGRHGVLIEERMEPQPFEVDVVIEADLGTAVTTDDLGASVDYGTVFEQARARVESGSFRLIEALAGAVADDILAAHERAVAVTVRVRKPHAPLPGTFETVEATIRRTRR